MIKEWIQQYNPQNHEEAEAALREIMQEVALAGLQRSFFFEKAAFYGGTALRIFHGLDRFSEDLDFSLLEVDPLFRFNRILTASSLSLKPSVCTLALKKKRKLREQILTPPF